VFLVLVLDRVEGSEVNRRGAKNLSLFHRLGILMVILGMGQSLAPAWFRPARSSLRLMERLRVALTPLESHEGTLGLVLNSSTLPSQAEQNQESDQESHDSEDLAETFTWTEAMTDRRSVQGLGVSSPLGSISKPGRDATRVRSALQRTRSLSIHAASSSRMTTLLCRLTC